jgi:hypothetical protein
MPTLGKWTGCIHSQKHPDRVRRARVGRRGDSGLRSLTRNASGGDTEGRLRCEAATDCNRSCRPA